MPWYVVTGNGEIENNLWLIVGVMESGDYFF